MRRSVVVTLAVALPLSALVLPTRAQAVGSVPVLVSRATGAAGAKGLGLSPPPSSPPFDAFMPSVSANGQFVVFTSTATNLDPLDPTNDTDVYVRDLVNNTTELISRNTAGMKGDSGSYAFQQAISADGRYVVFLSNATNLDPADSGGDADVFLRDRQTNTTTLVSRANGAAGAEANFLSQEASISADGTHVAFTTTASNLTGDDLDTTSDVIVRDLGTATNTLVDRANGLAGAKANGAAGAAQPKLSTNGQFVTFNTDSTNLDPADTGTTIQVYLRDVTGGQTTLISRATGVAGAPGASFSSLGFVSDDGNVVTYNSQSNNLDPADVDTGSDVFQRNVSGATTTLISRATGVAGAKQNDATFGVLSYAASSDGRYVAFSTTATNLDPIDNDGHTDAYLRDTQASTTTLISRAGAAGAKGDGDSDISGLTPDASTLVMASQAANLDPADADGVMDTYAITEPAPPPPPPPPPPPGGGGETPGDQPPATTTPATDGSDGAGDGAASNDPNPTTNPGPSDPAANTPTAPCSGGCSAGVTGQEATMVVTATNTVGGGSSAMELPERRSTTLFAELNGGGAMPSCPHHQPLYHEWIRFGFKEQGVGGTYRKSVTITSRHGYALQVATAMMRKQQVCFEAPYRFTARSGYGIAHHDGVWSGVLPSCGRHPGTAAGPCLSRRHLIKGGAGKWFVQVIFRIPPSAKDPKALG